jgi:AhpD family alkylhydroperoxidase
MTQRLNYSNIAPDGVKALFGMYSYIAKSGLPGQLIDLVYLRVSQINGCAYCIDMHSQDLIRKGVPTKKLMLVQAWRDAGDLFSAQEQVSLAMAEYVTNAAIEGVPDVIYEDTARIFSDKEVVDLTMAIALMNAYNRLSITFRNSPSTE